MKFLALGVALCLLAACGGSSSGGGVSFHQFCADLKANQTVSTALYAVENALPGAPSGSIATAATDAATLAAEAPVTPRW